MAQGARPGKLAKTKSCEGLHGLRETYGFEEMMNPVFDTAPLRWGHWPMGGYDLPLDIFATEDKVVVRLELPGVKPDDLDVTFHDDARVVTGIRHLPWDADKVRPLHRGIFYGEFTERIALPRGLRSDDAEAHYEDGILELTIPVTGGGQAQAHLGWHGQEGDHQLPAPSDSAPSAPCRHSRSSRHGAEELGRQPLDYLYEELEGRLRAGSVAFRLELQLAHARSTRDREREANRALQGEAVGLPGHPL
jgi:HSP20 family protein